MRVENVSKVYHTIGEEVYALKGINLKVHKNDFITILGPSGSGKSTLLHILGLLDEPTHGQVYLNGIETSALDENARAHLRGQKIGIIFQVFNLVPTLTVLENVILPALIYEKEEKIARSKATRILETIGMADRLTYYPNQLSGGQRQRVAIARALINEPEIILADEPTGNLDSTTGQDVLNVFKSLHDEGKTVIIISHDLNVTRITEEMLQIKDGMIVSHKTKGG